MTILDLVSVHEGMSLEERNVEHLWTALNSSHFFLIFFLSLVSRQFFVLSTPVEFLYEMS